MKSQWDFALIGLSILAFFAVATRDTNKTFRPTSPLIFLFLAFLLTSMLSAFFSENMFNSLRFGFFLLPGTLLFFLIGEHFDSPKGLDLLYATLSFLGLGLAFLLLWTAWTHPEIQDISNTMARTMGSPLIIVANDVIILSLLAPFSAVLIYKDYSSHAGIVGALSIILSIGAIVSYQSRGAFLTMIVSLAIFAFITVKDKARKGFPVALGLGLISMVLIVDWIRGFSLMGKVFYGSVSNRIFLWASAWEEFLRAPIIGNGPHSLMYHEGTSISYAPWVNNLYVDMLAEQGLLLTYREGMANSHAPWAHNLYVEMLAEQGILGFLALVLLLGYAMKLAWKIWHDSNPQVRMFGAGIVAALSGFCLAGVYELSFIRQWVVLLLFTILGLILNLSSGRLTVSKGVR